MVGNNYPWTPIITSNATVNSDDTWSKKVTIDDVTINAGTYTVYAVAIDSTDVPANETDTTSNFAYDTVVLTLKQPFLTATAASSTVAKGDKIKITGTAEATDSLKYYVFGTNLFKTDSITVNDDSTYSKKIDTTDYDAGQYYVIIQHPMENKVFNILGNNSNYNIYQNYTGEPTNMTTGIADGNTTVIFNARGLQSANAADALKVALNNQYIDDQFVSLYFVVETPYMTLGNVADQTKGSIFNVSGTTNVVSGEVVTVEVTSTAFVPGSKTSATSTSSYLVATTKVVAGTDGVNKWTVTFDTTGLDVDSYTVNAKISTKNLATSTTFKVTEAAPTKTATTTATATKTATATTTPTPQSPGFGAFLALAGLGAVAVLVLRRN
jgi:PGF-CTERM protein